MATFAIWTLFVAGTFFPPVACFGDWQAPAQKVKLDTNGDGVIQEEECICGLQDDLFNAPPITRDNIDYSQLKRFEGYARTLAAAATALNGDISPDIEVQLQSNLIYEDPRGILGCWLGYTPDSYGVAFNRSYDMTKGVKLVSYLDCGLKGKCDYRDEHPQYNLTERFFEQLGRNATLHHPYVYAKGCCNPVSFGDYLGTSEWAWMWNYFSTSENFTFWTYPLRDYLYGNKTWLDAGMWSDPYVDPVAGVMVSYGVPFVTRVPLLGSVDPFFFETHNHTSPGYMKSFEGLYVMGVAGLDVRLNDIVLSCPEGYYSTYPTCTQCEIGKYRSALDSADMCKPCAAGTYTTTKATLNCELCTRGTFQRNEGQSTCEPCEPGSAQGERGMSTCLHCAPGSAIDSWNASECIRCGIGRFEDSRGATQCQKCPSGMATGGLGSVFVAECLCAEGTYLGLQSNKCESCPNGMKCGVGSVDPAAGDERHSPLLLPGYYSSLEEPLSVYACAEDKSCPGGLPGTCGGGHIGLACQLCPPGQYASTETDCRGCDSAGMGPFIALSLVCLFGISASHVSVNFPLLKTKRTSMAGVFLAGLVITTMLTFNIYANLNTNWVSPLSDLFAILKVLAFDLKLLKFSCLAGSSKLMPRYAFKLAAVPGAFLIIVVAAMLLLTNKWTRKYAFFTFPDLINSGGLIFSVFFIAVSLASLEGFMCIYNPNGLESLISDRSVVCWKSLEHTYLLVASTLAILFYPVNFLVVTTFCTFKYYRLAERFGTKFTFCMRFLMNRWNPDQYYFGTIFTLRNFALTIAPLTQPNNYDIQVTLLQLIFLCWLVMQLSFKPWRFDILNKFDAITSAMQIVVLNCFGLIGGKAAADSLGAEGAGYLAFGVFMFVIVLTFTASAFSLAQKFRSMKEYGLFLSHHKGADALYARQIKMMMATLTTRQVFLDVDNLASLDELVFLVRSCVDNLVVMLSPETLNRFWCAVEIICAVQNRMPIILTNTHAVENLLGAEYLDKTSTMWGPGELLDFNKVGISGSTDTEIAYRCIATLPIIQMFMHSSESAQFQAVSKVLSLAKHCHPEARIYKIESHLLCYITYNTFDFVQATCARILNMLMKCNRWNSSILFDENNRVDFDQSVMLVLLSKDFTKDPIGLGHVCYSNQNGVPFTSIVSQEDFQRSKPSKEWMLTLSEGHAYTPEQMAILHRVAPDTTFEMLVDLVTALYAKLAARLNPQDSEHMLLVEMTTIIKRAEANLAKFVHSISSAGAKKTKESSWNQLSITHEAATKFVLENSVVKGDISGLSADLLPAEIDGLGPRILETDDTGACLAFRDI